MRARADAERRPRAELSALKEERDVIRTRVDGMLEQLEALNSVERSSQRCRV